MLIADELDGQPGLSRERLLDVDRPYLAWDGVVARHRVQKRDRLPRKRLVTPIDAEDLGQSPQCVGMELPTTARRVRQKQPVERGS